VTCAGEAGEDDVHASWQETITGVADEIEVVYPDPVEVIGGRRVLADSFTTAQNDVRSDVLPYLWNVLGSEASTAVKAHLTVGIVNIDVLAIEPGSAAAAADSVQCVQKQGQASTIRLSCGEGLVR